MSLMDGQETTGDLAARRHSDGIIRSLLVIDSSVRNGQFLYAHREIRKLLAEIARGEYDTDADLGQVVSSLKMTELLMKPVLRVYSQNQATLDVARRVLGCRNKPRP